MSRFASLLAQLRERSHKSPRAFYLGAGGPKFFGCTYRQYYNVERGQSLPSPRTFTRVVSALSLSLAGDDPDGRKLLRAYLEELLGDELFQLCTRAFSTPELKGHDPLLRRAVDKHFSEVSVRLDREQSEFMLVPENNWVGTVLGSDRGSWTAEKMAKTTGLAKAAAEKSLKGLEKLGLAVKDKDGGYRSPYVGKALLLMPREGTSVASGVAPDLTGPLPKDKQRTMLRQPVYIRASESELRGYYPQLLAALRGVELFSRTDGDQDTAMFELQTTVRRLFTF